MPSGPAGSEHGSAGVGELGFLPPEWGLSLLLRPPPDAPPGDSLFICSSGLPTRPPSFPHPLPGIFSPGDYQVSRPSLSAVLRFSPSPPPRGLSPPFSARLSPPVSLPRSLPPRLCPSTASPFRDYLICLWGESSSLDLCSGLSLLIFFPRKSSLPFRLPLTGERGENVVVIGWAGVSSSAVISLVSVLVLHASRW